MRWKRYAAETIDSTDQINAARINYPVKELLKETAEYYCQFAQKVKQCTETRKVYHFYHISKCIINHEYKKVVRYSSLRILYCLK